MGIWETQSEESYSAAPEPGGHLRDLLLTSC